MRMGVVHDAGETERFIAVCEALEDLGHETVCIDLTANSFLEDLVSGRVDAVFDATGDRGGNRTLAQLLKAMRIPLLRDGYCYQHLGCLLNMKNVEEQSIRQGYGRGH
jgi:hypothetical protein